ncbi:unnamed protein product [Symbiodinium natans]|uniref:Uncharacterized protein n=1 Tax=Symbiodinium natans TaxID=878477 RepID=A0A812NWX0_9DINO|nr:unnamed protein product [Symbiodinium natans]
MSVRNEPGLSQMMVVHGGDGVLEQLQEALLATQLFERVLGSPSGNTVAWATGLESSSSNDSSVLVFGHFAGRAKVAWDSVELLKGLSEHPRWGHRLSVLLGPGEEKLVRCRHRNVNDCFNDFKETDGRTVQLLTWLRQRPVITIWSNILLVHGQLSLPMLDDIVMDAWKKRREIACEVPGSECGREVVDIANSMCNLYFASVHECFLRTRATTSTSTKIVDSGNDAIWRDERTKCAFRQMPPFVLQPAGRGRLLEASGLKVSEGECSDWATAAQLLGLRALVVASTPSRPCAEAKPVLPGPRGCSQPCIHAADAKCCEALRLQMGPSGSGLSAQRCTWQPEARQQPALQCQDLS